MWPGAGYVFAEDGEQWTEVQKLVASDGAATDYYGTSVTVSGSTIVIGASHDDNSKGADAGAL